MKSWMKRRGGGGGGGDDTRDGEGEVCDLKCMTLIPGISAL